MDSHRSQKAETDWNIKASTVCARTSYRRGGSEASKQEQRPQFISCKETESRWNLTWVWKGGLKLSYTKLGGEEGNQKQSAHTHTYKT